MDPVNPKPEPKTDDQVGEESLGGTTTAPDADDDAAQALGGYLGNTPQPNEPLDIAREIDNDENAR